MVWLCAGLESERPPRLFSHPVPTPSLPYCTRTAYTLLISFLRGPYRKYYTSYAHTSSQSQASLSLNRATSFHAAYIRLSLSHLTRPNPLPILSFTQWGRTNLSSPLSSWWTFRRAHTVSKPYTSVAARLRRFASCPCSSSPPPSPLPFPLS